jgi:phenylacetate-CoA ligase
MPYSETIWDECETWSREQIEAYQLQALRKQLTRVGQRSVYYSEVFERAGFNPQSLNNLSDLRKLPFTYKSDYVKGLDVFPPFGTLAAVDASEAVRIHFSSGTTGRPTPVLWTQDDIERWAHIYARYLYAQGVRKTDVFQVMFNYAWFVGGLGYTLAAQKIGAMVIPASSGDTERQVETIFQYGTTYVVGTPSFMAHIAETAQKMGRDLASSTVRSVGVGGEPGAGIPGTRERIERLWGAKMLDCYGALEFQPIAFETAAQNGPTLAEDFVYAEVVHPDTHEPVPDGQRGVLVLTHLDKQACPLVRWWTGDVVVRDRTPATDGRTHARLPGGVLGRADDMLIIRGVNLFPSAVENLVRGLPQFTNEYVLVIDDSLKDSKTGFLTGVKLRVEFMDMSQANAQSEMLAAVLRDKLQVRFQVEVLPAGSLPRTVHKAKRVIYE